MPFAAQFPDLSIVVTASRQLSGSYFIALLPLKSQEAKLYYAQASVAPTFEQSRIAHWQHTRNRPAIHNTFKDPCFLDFSGLQNTYLEKDAEILRAPRRLIFPNTPQFFVLLSFIFCP